MTAARTRIASVNYPIGMNSAAPQPVTGSFHPSASQRVAVLGST